MRRELVGLAMVAVGVTLSACSSVPVPEFEGPWGAEFEQEYSKATSDFVRAALRDGAVSEQEYSETVSRYEECLSLAGITINELSLTGQMDYTYAGDNSDDAVASEKRCSNESGYYPIGMLYGWVYANPQKLDVAEITAACLIRAGAVLPDYTSDDYRKEVPTGEFSLIVDSLEGQDALSQCSSAPLTAFTE